jgi:malonate transporter
MGRLCCAYDGAIGSFIRSPALMHVNSPFAREALVCCSFPLATVAVLFAARYKAVESEAASLLLVSTLALAITVPTILWLSK